MVCVASTFNAQDYDGRSVFKSLEFEPQSRFHQMWANAVNAMSQDAAAPAAAAAAEQRSEAGAFPCPPLLGT